MQYSDTIHVYTGSQLYITVSTAWENVKIPLPNNISTGSAFSFDSTNKRAICNKSGIIDIWASFNWYAGVSPKGDYAICIYKNNTRQFSLAYVGSNSYSPNYRVINGQYFGFAVNKGDYIDMRIMSGSTGQIRTFDNTTTGFILKYRRA